MKTTLVDLDGRGVVIVVVTALVLLRLAVSTATAAAKLKSFPRDKKECRPAWHPGDLWPNII